MPTYLTTPIVEVRATALPNYGMTVHGYTKRSGAPTSKMVRLDGDVRWRRLMVWQFSNAGTCFLRILGVPHIVTDHQLDATVIERAGRMETLGITEEDLALDPEDMHPE